MAPVGPEMTKRRGDRSVESMMSSLTVRGEHEGGNGGQEKGRQTAENGQKRKMKY